MNQLYYPLEPNHIINTINTTDITDYSTNLQNIYSNIEYNIKKNTKSEKLVILKDELYKELTNDNEDLFHEVIEEILNEKKSDLSDISIVEDDDDDDGVNNEDNEILEDNKSDKSSNTDKSDYVQEFRNSLLYFKKEFIGLQEKFLVIDKNIKKETEKTNTDIKILENMINFVNNLDEKYSETPEIKTINENIIILSDKIKTNNGLKEAKRDYVRIRVELNDCFSIIKSINNLNYSNTCSLCLTNKVDEFIDPCGHSFCNSCKDRLIEYEGSITDANCPTCRGFIRDFKPLYL